MLLEVVGIGKSFGGLIALQDVSFHVRQGEVVSVIGPNGAGKTTLFNIITGLFSPDSGDIFFDGQKTTGTPPHELCHLGLSRSFQITNIFQGLTVFENIRLAAQGKRKGFNLFGSVKQLRGLTSKTREILKQLRLWEQRDELAGNLSYGDQRYLEIGMALASEPKMLLLDEPTAGMTPKETRAAIELINQLKNKVTILLIEHDIEMVFEVSERITVLHQGRVLADGSPGEVRANEAVQEAYFGEEM